MHQKGSVRQHACSGGQSIDTTNLFRFPQRPGDLRFLTRLMQFPRVHVDGGGGRVGMTDLFLHEPGWVANSVRWVM